MIRIAIQTRDKINQRVSVLMTRPTSGASTRSNIDLARPRSAPLDDAPHGKLVEVAHSRSGSKPSQSAATMSIVSLAFSFLMC
jgi:hypothetical protein